MPPKPFIVPVFIPHAGCPHQCLFCNQRATTGRSATFPQAGSIRAEIDRFLAYRRDKRRPTEISFYGGNFLGLSPDRIADLLDLAADYVRCAAADGIRFSTRPDTIDPERIELITNYPVTTVELGVQSMRDDVLALCRRGHTSTDVRDAVAGLRTLPELRLGLQMMIGLPGDSEAGALDSAVRIADLGPDFTRIYPTLVLEGSPLARWYSQGRYTPLSLTAAVDLARRISGIFQSRGIPVIRMGLQPTEELSTSAALIAGPFHPAFGDLVHSAAWLDSLIGHLQQIQCTY